MASGIKERRFQLSQGAPAGSSSSATCSVDGGGPSGVFWVRSVGGARSDDPSMPLPGDLRDELSTTIAPASVTAATRPSTRESARCRPPRQRCLELQRPAVVSVRGRHRTKGVEQRRDPPVVLSAAGGETELECDRQTEDDPTLGGEGVTTAATGAWPVGVGELVLSSVTQQPRIERGIDVAPHRLAVEAGQRRWCDAARTPEAKAEVPRGSRSLRPPGTPCRTLSRVDLGYSSNISSTGVWASGVVP